MKNKKIILIIFITILIFIYNIFYTGLAQTSSQAATITPVTTFQSTVAEPNFTVNSQGAVLMEKSTGIVLYEKNPNEKLYPASTTKILTAIIAIENCSPTEKITASYDAVMSLPSGYSNAAIQPNETLTCQELLDMFLIHSANEVGTIFAEHISGNVENFAILMNQKANSLGCKNSNFTNPSGIHDPEHYSTAYDMCLIARYCMQNETFRNTVSKLTCTIEATDKYEKRFFRNTNDLIDPKSDFYYEYAIGVKTGYTRQAKYCLISASAKNDIELIAVSLGAGKDERLQDSINLFEYGFSNYTLKQVATKNDVAKEIIVENATKDTENLSLLIKNDLTALASTNLNLSTLNASIYLNESILAPISEGDVLGKITYNIEGVEYTSDLIAGNNVEEFDLINMLKQIALALLIVFIFAKLILPKKKSKKRNSKKGNSKYKKSKNNRTYKKYNNSIYKF